MLLVVLLLVLLLLFFNRKTAIPDNRLTFTGGDAETMRSLADPFLLLLLRLLLFRHYYFFKKKTTKSRVINTLLPTLPTDILDPLTNLVSL